MGDKTLEETLKQLPALFKEREERLEEREKELERLKKTLEEEFPGAGKPDDVLPLDVGGTPITVLRRTLTQVEGSMLASRFSGRWDDSIEKSVAGRFFIDQPIELFLPLINYLRAMASETPFVRPPKPPVFKDEEMRFGFYRMIEYYGMSLGVYPIGVYRPHLPNATKKTLVASHPDYEYNADEFSTFCLLPLDDRHSQRIRSFEVRLAKDSPAQVGWVDMGFMAEVPSQAQNGTQGVGYSERSIAYDVLRGGMVVQQQFRDIPTASVQAGGSVIRCEDRGASWYIDGDLMASTVENSTVAHISAVAMSTATPCISVKGKFEFTAIEFVY